MGGTSSYLMGKGQGELDLVGRSLSVPSALEWGAEGRRTGPQGRAGKTKGAHLAGERIEMEDIKYGLDGGKTMNAVGVGSS